MKRNTNKYQLTTCIYQACCQYKHSLTQCIQASWLCWLDITFHQSRLYRKWTLLYICWFCRIDSMFVLLFRRLCRLCRHYIPLLFLLLLLLINNCFPFLFKTLSILLDIIICLLLFLFSFLIKSSSKSLETLRKYTQILLSLFIFLENN